jgi:hypothetical protein
MLAVTELGDTVVVVAVTVAVFIWLAWKRAWRPAAYWIAPGPLDKAGLSEISHAEGLREQNRRSWTKMLCSAASLCRFLLVC